MSEALRVVPETPATDRRPIDPDGHLWETAGLVTFPLTAGSAFVLQAMHPTIATVVDKHSTFRTDPFGRAARSIASVLTWVYGGQEALAEGDRLRSMHAPLSAYDEAGVRHTALSSEPYAWVILTAPYAFEAASRYFSLRPASQEELEATYQDLMQVARNLHVAGKELPGTYAEYRELFDEVVEDVLVPHPVAHEVLATFRHIARPGWVPRTLDPAWRLASFVPGRTQYFVTVGTLPDRAREKLGLRWTATDELALHVLGLGIGLSVAVLPERLRYFPIAYRARKAHRADRELRAALARRPR